MVDENSGNRPNFTIFFKTQILTSSFPHPLPWSQKFNVTENGRKWSDAQKWQKCINFSIYCPPLNGIFLSQNSQNWFGFLKWKLGHPLDTWQKKALRSGWIPHLPKKIVARIFTQVIFYREILNLFFFLLQSLSIYFFPPPKIIENDVLKMLWKWAKSLKCLKLSWSAQTALSHAILILQQLYTCPWTMTIFFWSILGRFGAKKNAMFNMLDNWNEIKESDCRPKRLKLI